MKRSMTHHGRTRILSIRRATWNLLLYALLALPGLRHDARAQAAPELVATNPANGAAGVSVGSSFTFTFNQEMNSFVPLIPTIPAVLVGNLEFTPSNILFGGDWSADGRMLTLQFLDDLPANTAVTWKLNPPGTSFPITSQSGVQLATISGTFTTGPDGNGGNGNGGNGTAPRLVSANPANGASDVPVTASVQFVFDQAMEANLALGGFPPFVTGAIAWSGAGLQAALFSYDWSADGRTVTCAYAGLLPGNTTISWVLNPAGALVELTSAAGEPLPPAVFTGSFTTGEGDGGGGDDCSPDGVPGTWGSYAIVKSFRYEQNSAADPLPLPSDEGPFTFGVFVSGPEGGPSVTSGSVSLPSNVQLPLTGLPFGGLLFYSESLPSDTALDAAYPNGTYTLRFTQSGQSERTIPMNMAGGQPIIPKVVNFTDVQAVNAQQDFPLRWNSYTGAGANDAIRLTISDSDGRVVFGAPDFCVPRELPVTATSIVVPAETLQPNRTYHAALAFSRAFYTSTNTVPEMAGFGGVDRSTEFLIRTGSGALLTPARFTAYRVLPNGRPELTLTGTAQGNYTIQRSQDLGAGDWTDIGTATIAVGGAAVFEDLAAPATRSLFYRAVAP